MRKLENCGSFMHETVQAQGESINKPGIVGSTEQVFTCAKQNKILVYKANPTSDRHLLGAYMYVVFME